MEYKFANGSNADFILLCHELNAYLDELVGNKFDRSPYIPFNQLEDIHDVVIAYHQAKPIGCASYKKYDDGVAEMKRVFVRSGYRGKGISKTMLKKLEERAIGQGYREMILETGEPLEVSMKLYKSNGYEIIPNYAQYIDMPDSICMRKYL